MNQLESQLHYPLGAALPAAGAACQVAPGLAWLRMPLPFALDHINLWLLNDDFSGGQGGPRQAGPRQAGPRQTGWSVVDCGVANDVTRSAWEQLFASALDGLPLQRVLVTHCHPDHVGLAGWLHRRWSAPLWMTCGEYGLARMLAAALPGADGNAALAHFQRHGLAPALLEQMQERKDYYPSLVAPMPPSYTRLQDAQVLTIGAHDWRVITGCGHSPEHAALYCAGLNVLIAGDMVLPRISTNVSVFALEPEADPLACYLASLDKFADLPHDTLVLPAHGKPFRGLHTRIAQLRAHHDERLAEVLHACAAWQSAADIVPLMFRRALDVHQLSFALGEALAHLHLLHGRGQLERSSGADGIIRFRMM